jgi:DNA-3-methyladenine glycosylase II
VSLPLSCEVALPRDHRAGDLLAFHGRDPSSPAERIEGTVLRKGLVWRGRPASLALRLGPARARAELSVDGLRPGPADRRALEATVRRMLGLDQPVRAFEDAHRADADVGRLIARNPRLRLPVSPSPFEALSWAVTGQQISLAAALSIRRRLLAATAIAHSGGLLCYPDAAAVARLREATLRRAGFSAAKARTLRELGRLVASGRLPLDDWLLRWPGDEAGARLAEVRGVGPWTVSYALLRGYGWLDGSLHGDVAVRRGLASLLERTAPVEAEEARRWLLPYSPWRALVAAHLWAWLRPIRGPAPRSEP